MERDETLARWWHAKVRVYTIAVSIKDLIVPYTDDGNNPTPAEIEHLKTLGFEPGVTGYELRLGEISGLDAKAALDKVVSDWQGLTGEAFPWGPPQVLWRMLWL